MEYLKKISKRFLRIRDRYSRKRQGFSLLEVVVGIAIVAIALLGLAQLFTYSVLTNARADRMSSATFLAQQQIDFHRSLTIDELNALSGGAIDEQIDVNNDGTLDYRRITQLQAAGSFWDIRVLVFSAEQIGEDVNALLQNPEQHDVKANMSTIIGR